MKNKFLRVAAAMAVCALISVCAVSGTFAKYVSSTSGTDSARVARWGFNSPAQLSISMFDTSYKTGESDNVKSANTDKVIAPGTEGSATVKFESNGTPEVAYTYAVGAEFTEGADAFDAIDGFKWTLKKGNENAVEYATSSGLVDAINAFSGNYAPGELPAVSEFVVGWKWAFEGDNAKDTELGNAADLAKVSLKITITATQKD